MKKDKSTKQFSFKRPTALCLGGGGTRGYAHLGALKAFAENDIEFDFVIGTSVGALIGAAYCNGVDLNDLIEFGNNLDLKHVHNGIIIVPNDPNKLVNLAKQVVGDANIENMPKRFVCVATDIKEGKQHIIESGNAAVAIAASCAVPMFFRPVVIDNRHLVDGGLLNNIPADVARMLGASAVVTVDINPMRGGGTDSLKMLDILKATFSIVTSNSSTSGLINSDVLIAPELVGFKPTSKKGFVEMFEEGYKAALEKIDAIKAL